MRNDSLETPIANVFFKSRYRSSTDNTEDFTRNPKRRRTIGLNARFDNMIRCIDATFPGPQSLQRPQTRTRSSSDVSHSPPVIADAYIDLHEGRIGENFTLVKMQPSMESRGSMQTDIFAFQTPFVRKDLPEWLCSTLSSLSKKHPLRLLLPNKLHRPQTDPNGRSPYDLKADSAFAFSPDRFTQTMPNDSQGVNLINSTSDRHHEFRSVQRSSALLDIYSLDSKDDVKEFQSLSAACGNVPLTLDLLSFSMPSPNIVSVNNPTKTFKLKEVDERALKLTSESKDLAFIPFSTPGPAFTLGSYVATNSIPPMSDSHATDCLLDADIETSACFPRHLATTFPTSHSRHTSTELSAIDSCLPPYRAATSDPAPAYSSDSIYDDVYYAPSRDEPGSEPRSLPPRTDDKCSDAFSIHGLGYCAPRPIFFDSPTEEPSDLNHSTLGYEIDLDAIDFKWTPFKRKSDEEKFTPGDQYRSELCKNVIPEYSELGFNCTVISRAGSPEAIPLPDALPSPNPFRFIPHQLTIKTNSACNHARSQTPQRTSQAKAFAPAPGTYLSPLRNQVEAQTAVFRTPQNQIIRNELRKLDLDVKTVFPSSQGSRDSIESWRDADENCP